MEAAAIIIRCLNRIGGNLPGEETTRGDYVYTTLIETLASLLSSFSIGKLWRMSDRKRNGNRCIQVLLNKKFLTFSPARLYLDQHKRLGSKANATLSFSESISIVCDDAVDINTLYTVLDEN